MLQRGPLVYCVEGADNDGEVWNLALPGSATLHERQAQIADERIVALQAEGVAAVVLPGGTDVAVRTTTLTAVPYYCWANRDGRQMQVWIPTNLPISSKVSADHLKTARCLKFAGRSRLSSAWLHRLSKLRVSPNTLVTHISNETQHV